MQTSNMSVNQLMRQVIYALALGVAAQVYFFGFSVLVQIVLAVVTAISAEALVLRMRGMKIKPSISDGSAALSGVLLAISIPSIAPWWIIVVGVTFGIVFGKSIFGGLGNNPFNPAMLGYAFLLISYPLQMTQWPAEFQGILGIFEIFDIDVLTGATNLDFAKTQLMLGVSTVELTFDNLSQMWINLGFLLGGIYLLLRRIIFWHIPVSLIFGLALMSGVLYLIDSSSFISPLFHLINGATMLAAFFIATDPVSASTTPLGRLIYGFAIGVIIIVIRIFGGYPDAVAFAVLLMNITVPLIDYYTQPKVFGK